MQGRSVTLFAGDESAREVLEPLASALECHHTTYRWAPRMEDGQTDIGIWVGDTGPNRVRHANFAVVLPKSPLSITDFWRNFWVHQPWDDFDLGLVPGGIWQTVFLSELHTNRSRGPRLGLGVVGWPIPAKSCGPPTVLRFADRRLALALADAKKFASHLARQDVRVSLDDPETMQNQQPQNDDIYICDDVHAAVEHRMRGRSVVLISDDALLLSTTRDLDLVTVSRPQALEEPFLARLISLPTKTDSEPPEFYTRGLFIDDNLSFADTCLSLIRANLGDPTYTPLHRHLAQRSTEVEAENQGIKAACQKLLSVSPREIFLAANICFDEEAYRAQNRDVDAALRASQIDTGLRHWQAFGFREGRHGPFLGLSGQKPKPPPPSIDNYETMLHNRTSNPTPSSTQLTPPASQVIIFSPFWDERVGGCMSLYKLCFMLRQRGVDARMWAPFWTPGMLDQSPWNLPFANDELEPSQSIAIYPEVLDGNPLESPFVVRWLLNRPGVLASNSGYATSDLIMHHGPPNAKNPDLADELFIFHCDRSWLEPAGQPKRDLYGCVAYRKGKNRRRVALTQGCIDIDGLSRDEIAHLFKRCRYFFSYDIYTFSLVQAALSGATPVVVPQEKMPAHVWRENYKLGTYGIAYGPEEELRAVATRSLVGPHLDFLEAMSKIQTEAFVHRLRALKWLSA